MIDFTTVVTKQRPAIDILLPFLENSNGYFQE
jgi:hypothetical protein